VGVFLLPPAHLLHPFVRCPCSLLAKCHLKVKLSLLQCNTLQVNYLGFGGQVILYSFHIYISCRNRRPTPFSEFVLKPPDLTSHALIFSFQCQLFRAQPLAHCPLLSILCLQLLQLTEYYTTITWPCFGKVVHLQWATVQIINYKTQNYWPLDQLVTNLLQPYCNHVFHDNVRAHKLFCGKQAHKRFVSSLRSQHTVAVLKSTNF